MVLKGPAAALALAALLAACVSSRPDPEHSAFPRRDARDSLRVVGHRGDTAMFYGFDLEGIADSLVAHLVYVGSVQGRHAFVIDQKYPQADRAYRILLDSAACEVANPRDVQEEHIQFGASPRRPRRKDGKCLVEDPLLY